MDYNTIYPKVLARLFPDSEKRQKAEAIMSQYKANEVLRVKTAILKAAGADLEQVRKCTEAACLDFRDVLCWAEYPAQLTSEVGVTNPSLIRQDRQQYQEWIDSMLTPQ